MQELQCLFALMLGTHRRFVDPTAALELLREAFRTAEEQQVKCLKILSAFTTTALAKMSVMLHLVLRAFLQIHGCRLAGRSTVTGVIARM